MIAYEADDALAMLRPGEDHLVNVRLLPVGHIVNLNINLNISIHKS